MQKNGELEIYCSQCGSLIKCGNIVLHWQEKHGYKVHGFLEKQTAPGAS